MDDHLQVQKTLLRAGAAGGDGVARTRVMTVPLAVVTCARALFVRT